MWVRFEFGFRSRTTWLLACLLATHASLLLGEVPLPQSQWSGGDAAQATLYSHSFWNTSDQNSYSSALKVQITSLAASMPAALQASTGLSDRQKAEQLQWALHIANHLTSQQVSLVIPAATFDFSALTEAHPDTPSLLQAFLPKLYVMRDNLTIRSLDEANPPLLTYAGPGADGSNHARVLLMIADGVNSVTIDGIHFQGDHSWEHLAEVPFYVHENAAALRLSDVGHTVGLIMIGWSTGTSAVTVQNSVVDRFNLKGLNVVGPASILNTKIVGVLPLPQTTDYQEYPKFRADYQKHPEYWRPLFQAVSSPETPGLTNYYIRRFLGLQTSFQNGFMPQIGFGFQAAIEVSKGNGAPFIVSGCTINHVLQGVTGGSATSLWTITDNIFSVIGDHGIYLLGNFKSSKVLRNSFDGNYGPAIKFGGTTNTTETPMSHLSGSVGGEIANNRFANMHNVAIQVSGSFNSIHDNEMNLYSVENDPSRGGYNPVNGSSSPVPAIWLTTHGGQSHWFSHVIFNKVERNRADVGALTVLLDQTPAQDIQNDRSIVFNYFAGNTQRVFVHARRDSRFPPLALTDGNVAIRLGAPPECLDCDPKNPYYLNDGEVTRVRSTDQNATSGPVLFQYLDSPLTYVLHDDGSTEALDTPPTSIGGALLVNTVSGLLAASSPYLWNIFSRVTTTYQ